MSTGSRDPIINVVHGQLKKDVRILIENKCYSGAVKLIYSGIDIMAWLDMPKKKHNSVRKEQQAEYFRKWVGNYIIDPNGLQLDALLWENRNAMLHTHTLYSRKMRRPNSKVLPVGFIDIMQPPVKRNDELCMISVQWLAESFSQGVDKFLIRIFDDRLKRNVAEARLNEMVHVLHSNK